MFVFILVSEVLLCYSDDFEFVCVLFVGDLQDDLFVCLDIVVSCVYI